MNSFPFTVIRSWRFLELELVVGGGIWTLTSPENEDLEDKEDERRDSFREDNRPGVIGVGESEERLSPNEERLGSWGRLIAERFLDCTSLSLRIDWIGL